MQRLLLVYGGRSTEHDVSIRTAREVVAALDRDRFDPVVLGVGQDGVLRTGPAEGDLAEIVTQGPAVDSLTQIARSCDVVFPLLHGPFGEDGTLQGLLEFEGIPYAGSGVLASALCMDKGALKHFISASPHDIPVAPGLSIDLGLESLDEAHARASAATETLGWPLFVKPSRQGSSVGISRAADAAALRTALEEASSYDRKIVVEQALDAREIELAILGDGGPATIVSEPGEIVLPEGSWYDYDNKYENDVAGLQIPAELADATRLRLQGLARQAFEIAGCTGLARIDFFVDRSGASVWLNEINTMPGFTSISMYPKLMAHHGIPYRDLITRIVEMGLAAHADRRALRFQR
jgi:D-alanine--D-alanine ligase